MILRGSLSDKVTLETVRRQAAALFRMAPSLVIIAVSAAMTFAFLSNTRPARAVQFHYFSSGIEQKSPTTYSAVREVRQDKQVNGIPVTGCNDPIAGDPVYQTMWFKTNDGGFLELGTGHQCGDDFEYWFEGRGTPDNSWHLLDYQRGVVTDGVSHTFKITRTGQIYWFRVDSSIVGPGYGFSSAMAGWQGTTVLESYVPSANVQYTSSSLAMARNEGSWTSWTTPHGQNIDYQYMCGSWPAVDSFRHGQPSGSC